LELLKLYFLNFLVLIIRMTEIRFFGKDGKYAIFSNFANTPLIIGGLKYPTVEHYFQSRKFADTDKEYSEEVRLAKTPLISKNLGKSRKHIIHPYWSGIDGESVKVMRRALFCKALQNKKFRELLVSTGNAKIIEASPWDRFWGEGKDKNGKNMLGKLLEELRERLRKFGKNIYTQENNGDEKKRERRGRRNQDFFEERDKREQEESDKLEQEEDI
jgi:N-glycosidase YbiA